MKTSPESPRLCFSDRYVEFNRKWNRDKTPHDKIVIHGTMVKKYVVTRGRAELVFYKDYKDEMNTFVLIGDLFG